MEFHEKLLMLRRKKGVTQQEAADALGVSRPTYGGYESGKRHPQRNAMYQRLADYFGVAIDELFPAKEADAPETPPAAAAQSDHAIIAHHRARRPLRRRTAQRPGQGSRHALARACLLALAPG